MKKMEHVIFLYQEDCWKGVENRVFTFFLFFLTFPMLASAYAQLRKVSFEVQNVNLAEIIAILENLRITPFVSG